MFLNLLFASLNAAKINDQFNTLIMVVEKFNDLPAWFDKSFTKDEEKLDELEAVLKDFE